MSHLLKKSLLTKLHFLGSAWIFNILKKQTARAAWKRFFKSYELSVFEFAAVNEQSY